LGVGSADKIPGRRAGRRRVLSQVLKDYDSSDMMRACVSPPDGREGEPVRLPLCATAASGQVEVCAVCGIGPEGVPHEILAWAPVVMGHEFCGVVVENRGHGFEPGAGVMRRPWRAASARIAGTAGEPVRGGAAMGFANDGGMAVYVAIPAG
jgi:threonine dehydrogenase-like Zn-dependent dehydrogenase